MMKNTVDQNVKGDPYSKKYSVLSFLTSTEVLLLSGITRVFPLLPGTIVDPILILGPTNM